MIRLYDYILERQAVTFGTHNSNYGNCIILAGGPGSGKGFAKDHRILADFKSVDVDELKKKYIKMAEACKIDDPKKYDLTNPEDTGELHMKVKERGWKKKQRALFWSDRQNQKKENLPNILWDMVSDNPDDIMEVIQYAKPLGYTVTVVWVCTHIDTARQQNQMRSRRVDDKVIIKGHKGAYKTMMELLDNKYPGLNEGIDAFWIIFTAGAGRKLTTEYEKDPVLKIKKDKDGGDFDFKEKQLVEDYFKKQMPEDPDWKKNQAAEKERKANVANAKAKVPDSWKRVHESYESENYDNFIRMFIEEIQEELLY